MKPDWWRVSLPLTPCAGLCPCFWFYLCFIHYLLAQPFFYNSRTMNTDKLWDKLSRFYDSWVFLFLLVIILMAALAYIINILSSPLPLWYRKDMNTGPRMVKSGHLGSTPISRICLMNNGNSRTNFVMSIGDLTLIVRPIATSLE